MGSLVRCTVWLFLAAGWSAALAVAADEGGRAWARFNEFAKFQMEFLSLPASERDKIRLHFDVMPPLGIMDPDQIVLMLQTPNGPQRLPLSKSWTLELPLDDTLPLLNPLITTNLPRGVRLELAPQADLRLPADFTFDYRYVVALTRQAHFAVNRLAGIFQWFAPDVQGIRLKFAPSAGGGVDVIELGQQSRLEPNALGWVDILLDDGLLARNPIFRLTAPPEWVHPILSDVIKIWADSDD